MCWPGCVGGVVPVDQEARSSFPGAATGAGQRVWLARSGSAARSAAVLPALPSFVLDALAWPW